MAGEGSMLHMIKTLRANKNLLKDRNSIFSKDRTTKSNKPRKNKWTFNILTPKQKLEAKKRGKNRAYKNIRTELYALFTIVISLSLFVWWIFYS
ncbi:MAG: hypothetical protein ABFR62_06030 [Bacteroidota bacterium]